MLFAELVEYLAQLEATTSRNRMVETLAEVFRAAQADEIDRIVYLSQGRVTPAYEPVEFGVGESLTAEAIAAATGREKAEVRRLYARQGDFGTVVEDLLPPEGKGLTVSEVFARLVELSRLSGAGTVAAKVGLLSRVLSSLGRREGRFFMRIPLNQLRLGIGDPTVMDALSFGRVGDKSQRKDIERAYNICPDLGLVARLYWERGREGLADLRVQIGRPVRPALAERAESAEAILKRLGRCAAEGKYDGFRCQVHRDGDQVKVYSRNLEDFSAMFPEIVAAAQEQVRLRQAIFEGEALAYEPATGDFLPFQVTVQRRRKYDISAMREKLPLKLVTFDLLYADGVDLTPLPYTERRQRLQDAVSPGGVIEVAEALVTGDPAELAVFFAAQVSRGLEGIVCKRLDSSYQAGARNFNWIKLKRSYQGHLADTVDTVIVGYWYGRGARARLGIGSLLTAVYDRAADRFVTISRLATGLTEPEWITLKARLDEVATPHRPARVDSLIEPDVWVEPTYVLELTADEITRSPIHTCGLPRPGLTPPPAGEPAAAARVLGYALRFPRAVGFLRSDKGPEDTTTVDEILKLYALQGRQ